MAGDRQTYRKKAANSASYKRTVEQSRRSSQARSGSPRRGDAAGAGIAERLASLFVQDDTPRAGGQRRSSSVRASRGAASAHAVDSFKTRFLTSKVAMGIAAALVVLVVVFLWDNVANYGKAYGNVNVEGKSVAGMTEEQIRTMLEEDFGQKLSSGEVRIYASDTASSGKSAERTRRENIAQAEQISVEEAKATVTSWVTSANGVRAHIPYDDIVQQALSAGRDGGPLQRLALFVSPKNITFDIAYDDKALEELASAIDDTLGDKRVDATVAIDEGMANAVKGHDGKMVDREWLKEQLSSAFMSEEAEPSFTAEVTDAPSRTTYEQAQQMATDINRALNSNVQFKYHSQSWSADPVSIGNWTRVIVAQVTDGYELRANLDKTEATNDLVKHLDASVSNANVIVDFEKDGDQIAIKTSGSGVIPEVGPAIAQANELLYGSAGLAFGSDAPGQATIDVGESNAPEELTFDQALDLGIIALVGEYTTEFSNAEGTENRNHNIKLAADLLNNTIAESNGGTWSFNEYSGDTNQDPPFASAGSIVDGEYVDSIGGGICQVATTVFNAVYEAGLPVVDRHNHSLYIASYPTGRDAAVSYPEMDFVWSNPHASDVLLKLSYTDTTITAKLYSTPIGYKVSTEVGEWEEGEKYRTDFEVDEDLPEGDYYLKTTGSDGSQISVTRTVTDLNGTIVSEDVFSSVYTPKNEVYSIGPGTDTSMILESNSEEGNTREEEDSEDENSEDEESGYEDEEGSGDDEEYEGYDTSSEDEYSEGEV